MLAPLERLSDLNAAAFCRPPADCDGGIPLLEDAFPDLEMHPTTTYKPTLDQMMNLNPLIFPPKSPI